MLFPQTFTCVRVDVGDLRLNVTYGGNGPPVLLLHGYPQTHAMWHAVAERLGAGYRVVCPDLRGYGDSDKPAGGAHHENYSKRGMAADCVALMRHFGYPCFDVVGHDRGARVGHRMALDHSAAVRSLAVLDIAPTLHMYAHTDQAFATGYYHWFFLIQPDGLPERLIGEAPAYFLKEKLARWSGRDAVFDDEAMIAYVRCFSDPACIHASCEDYRAGATIDLEHDRADRTAGNRVACPLLVLWGDQGFVHRMYDVLSVWRDYASHVRGHSLPCGHFLAEEQPAALCEALEAFLAR